MRTEKRNVFLLAGAQALFQTSAVMVLTLSALVGQMLAPDKRLATLPIALMIVGTAALMIPASLFMQRYGRKAGFLLGIACGGVSGLLAALALYRGDFWLFAASGLFVGAYQSFAQYYRFAAADAASTDFKSRAIAWVIAGGVFAALAGPNLARLTQDMSVTPFLAAYLALSGLSIVAALLIVCLRLPPPAAAKSDALAARPLAEIMRQPIFITALIGSTAGFSVMTMIMTATPLAMQFCGQALNAATTVIQWHVLGMFVPSFFTGTLIRRFGVLSIMGTGIALLGIHVLISFTGNEFVHFLSGLTLLGIGWNFLFIGGTSLLVQTYHPAEQAKTQAAHDFIMFSFVSVASLSAGGLLNAWGWHAVNVAAVPFLLLAACASVWLARKS